jgi:RecB family exonuclease
MQRRTLIRARDLSAFRDALAGRALSGTPLSARRRAVIVPTRAAGEILRQTLETRALDVAGRAVILPDLLTREDWLERLRASLPDAPAMLPRIARERVLLRACRASARRARVNGAPFELRPGLVSAMLDLYDELKRRQQSVYRFAKTLLRKLESVSGTDRGTEGLFQQTAFLAFAFLAYERGVIASRAWDEHLLRRHVLDAQPVLPFDHVIVAVADERSGPGGLWPADFDLLGRLSQLVTLDVVVTDEIHDAGFRERIEAELPGIHETHHEAPPVRPVIVRPAGDKDVLYWTSRDREEELRDVVRLIRARTAPSETGPAMAGQTAIVFRRPLPYLYLAKQVLGDARVPYQVFDALPLAAEPHAALVDLVLSVARTGGTRAGMVDLLRSSMLTFADATGPVGASEASALDAALANRRATDEADSYPAIVDDYFDDPETRRKERHAPARRAAVLAAAIRAELASYRVGPTAARIRAVSAFLRHHERVLPEDATGRDRHLRARAAILSLLDTLADACEADAVTADASEDPTPWIRHAIEAQVFAPRRGVAGVHLVDAIAARFGEFDHVHLVGLVETDWPERQRRSVFYTSGLLEPLGWSGNLAHAKAEIAAFRDLLGLARQTTSLHTFDLEGDGVVARSPLIDLARDVPAVDGPRATLPPIFADEILAAGARPVGLEVTTAEWLNLRRKRPAIDVDLRYRGHVDPRPPQAYRVTRVERYVDCAFKYFSESVLGLPDEREESESLTPLERGNLVHGLLEQFYREWQARGLGAITLANLPDALSAFETITHRALARLPAGDRALEEARLLGSLVSPGLAERVFQVETDSPGDLVDRLIEIRLDGTFVFPQLSGLKQRSIEIRAKADRIDVFADGRLRVIDYKSGKAPDVKTTLQIAVYAHVAKAVLEARTGRPHSIREALYLAFGDDDHLKNSLPAAPTVDDGASIRASDFARIVDLIEAGRFPARPQQDNYCEYCAFSGVCRKEYHREADEPAESV